MAIKLPEKNYFTFSELMRRWDCTEDDIRHLVVNGDLKPSYLINHVACVVTFVDAEDEAGRYWIAERIKSDVEYDEEDGTKVLDDLMEFTDGFYYLLFPDQIGVSDCTFRFFSKSRNVEKGPDATCLMLTLERAWPDPISMADVVKNGAFFLEEVGAFESAQGAKSRSKLDDDQLTTKVPSAVLKMVIGMAMDGYGYDPTAKKSPIPKELEKILKAQKIPVSDDMVRFYLKLAADTQISGKLGQS